ncbi:hypothetical protein [Sulfuricurvum sp.]|jgi:hypothetical protein|uniref:hypothetical protein n=1 Tax=Sulfuricurvum sp. TaxID=2025608 RepID=UPI0025D8984C|nr:hypothetical protein [Sulfuricurvum sp.]
MKTALYRLKIRKLIQRIGCERTAIDSIKTNFNTVGTATWEYEMTLSNNNKSETFSYKHEYGTYFVAANVCNATGQNFTRGIEAFLKSLYSDPRFLALLQ